MRRSMGLLVLFLGSGCFPNVGSENQSQIYSCKSNADCIDGYECLAGLCSEKGTVVPAADAGTMTNKDAMSMPMMDTGANPGDAGIQDATVPDATITDATITDDSGYPDASPMKDTGVAADAGVTEDGGTNQDAGPSVSASIRWAKRVGGTSFETATAVVTDSAGNVYMGGYFQGAIDFGDGLLRASSDGDDLFVVSYDSAGQLRWVVTTGGSGNDQVLALALDSVGKLIVVGTFSAALNAFNLNRTGNQAGTGFVAKLHSANGSPITGWALENGSQHSVIDVVVGGNDDIYVSGSFEGNVIFGNGQIGTSAGGSDGFAARYNRNGACQWVVSFGSATAYDRADNIAIDSNDNIYVTGTFQATANFGGSNLTSAGSQDIFLASYSASGAHRWSYRYGGQSVDAGKSVAVGANDSVYLTGYFGGTVAFGGNTLTASDIDVFVAKFAPDGTHQWSNQYGGSGRDEGWAIAVDSSGQSDVIFVSGFFSGTMASFGGGSIAGRGNSADKDAFVASFDALGGHRWSYGYGSTTWEYGAAVAAGPNRSVYLAGDFRGTIDFGMNFTATSMGSTEMFLLSLDQ